MPLHNSIKMFSPADISVDRVGRQRRLVEVDDQFLASIKQRGILSPLLVEIRPDGSGWLVCGERRLTAALALGLLAIPCRTCQDLTPVELQVYEFEENAKREDLCWQDSIRSIARVHELHLELDRDWTQAESCSVLAITQGYLSIVLRVSAQLEDERIASCSTVREAYNVIKRREDRAAANDLEELLSVPATQGAGPGAVSPYATQEVLSSGPVVTHDPRLPVPGPAVRPTFVPLTQAAPSVGVESILHVEFADWLASYSGPKFNLIHCDFPYGVGLFDGSQGIGSESRVGYSDKPDDYFALLELLLGNLNKIFSLSGHLLFWYSETHGPRTRQMFAELAPSLDLFKFPLIWLKSDNSGISSDAARTPRHIYETCLVASRGDRRLVKVAADAYAAPGDRKLHPSTKPEPMLRHFMGMFVDETTNLLDPTAGSGSALRAAESLGAKSVLGLERDEQYVMAARQALRNARLLKGN